MQKGTTMTRQVDRIAGFSLMEINMAVFVMAVGILSLVALFPLGLRESIQGKQDLQQSMFADYALNQVVAALSQTNLTWSEWLAVDGLEGNWEDFPNAIRKKVKLDKQELKDDAIFKGDWTVSGSQMQPRHYRIMCRLVDGASDRIMGVGVRSTDTDLSRWELYTNNVMYYAEVMFQGVPK